MIKMYAIFSREGIEKMKGNRGKMCAQAGHAYLHAWWNASELVVCGKLGTNDLVRLTDTMYEYLNNNDARKIALICDTDEELLQLAEDYKDFTGVTIVEDCGYTVVEPGTMTCIGIGPLRDSEKGDDLRDLALFL
jgi:peptidyl-tRNA hydrolase